MDEKRFNEFTEFLKRIAITSRISDSEIFVLNSSEISGPALKGFSGYRNEFYEINLFTNLKGFRYAIDGGLYETNGEPTIFFICPNQLQSYELLGEYKSASGFLIYIQKSSFKHIEKSTGIHFFKREYKPYYTVSEQDYQQIAFWANLMYKESKGTSAFKSQKLLNLLIVFLLKVKEIIHEELSPFYNRPQGIIGEFIELIDKSASIPKVSQCASDLALTPKQLNVLTKQVLGKTANEVIKTQFNDKAKAFLIQSQMSVKEIAQQLGFKEVSNFSRFFKGMNKVSPIIFREQKRNKLIT